MNKAKRALITAICVILLFSCSSCGGNSNIVCWNCSEEISSENKFCPHCGTAVGVVCQNCNESLSAGSRFCSYCGIEVMQEDAAGETGAVNTPDIQRDETEEPTSNPAVNPTLSAESTDEPSATPSQSPSPSPSLSAAPSPSPESGMQLTSHYPRGVENYIPKYDYCTAGFTKEIDQTKCPTATMENHTTGKTYELKTQRGTTSLTTLLVLFDGTLEPSCKYMVTIPANSVYGMDGSVYGREIVFSFTTSKELRVTSNNSSTESSSPEPEHTHSWRDATCTTPKTCSTCSETVGSALGHTPGEWIAEDPDYSSVYYSVEQYCSVCDAYMDSDIVFFSTMHENGLFLFSPEEFTDRLESFYSVLKSDMTTTLAILDDNTMGCGIVYESDSIAVILFNDNNSTMDGDKKDSRSVSSMMVKYFTDDVSCVVESMYGIMFACHPSLEKDDAKYVAKAIVYAAEDGDYYQYQGIKYLLTVRDDAYWLFVSVLEE